MNKLYTLELPNCKGSMKFYNKSLDGSYYISSVKARFTLEEIRNLPDQGFINQLVRQFVGYERI